MAAWLETNEKRPPFFTNKLIESPKACDGLILPIHGLMICAAVPSTIIIVRMRTTPAILPRLPSKPNIHISNINMGRIQ
ncbi:uncharacterized protein METZ01_LOCUS151938 [marine metagenome]|uniref:Uncharacterized protein n=1 Tax=marine metagenome TaxID=408172 RepID=A0A382ACI3_9ZZZZ